MNVLILIFYSNNWGSNSVVPNEKCVGLLKRKSDSAFAPPNKQRKTEKDPGVSQFNTTSESQSQNTDHCDQHENKSKPAKMSFILDG